MGSLTEKQKAVVIGCLLGDGAMRCKDNALLEINHSIEQKQYVDWKYGVLRNLVLTPPKARYGNKGRIAYRFTTRSLPELTEIYKRFFKNGKKIIPEDLVIEPLGLAIWFMDDGNKSYRAIYLNTQKFLMEEQLRLIKILKDQFDLNATLNKDKNYYRLRIAVESVEKFKKIIQSHLLTMFLYKLPS